MNAVLNGDTRIIKNKVESGIDINAFDEKGETALYKSVVQRNFSITRLLLQLGANPNIGHENHGDIPLTTAIYENCPAVISLLIEAGFDPSLPLDNDGVTPLMIAVDRNNLEIAKILLEAGVNINERDNRGYSALYYAAQNGHVTMMKFLQDMGATDDYSIILENVQRIDF